MKAEEPRGKKVLKSELRFFFHRIKNRILFEECFVEYFSIIVIKKKLLIYLVLIKITPPKNSSYAAAFVNYFLLYEPN